MSTSSSKEEDSHLWYIDHIAHSHLSGDILLFQSREWIRPTKVKCTNGNTYTVNQKGTIHIRVTQPTWRTYHPYKSALHPMSFDTRGDVIRLIHHHLPFFYIYDYFYFSSLFYPPWISLHNSSRTISSTHISPIHSSSSIIIYYFSFIFAWTIDHIQPHFHNLSAITLPPLLSPAFTDIHYKPWTLVYA